MSDSDLPRKRPSDSELGVRITNRKDKMKKLKREIEDLERDRAEELIKNLVSPIDAVLRFEVIDSAMLNARRLICDPPPKFKIFSEKMEPMAVPLVIHCSNGLFFVHTEMAYGNRWETWHVAKLDDDEEELAFFPLSSVHDMTQLQMKTVHRMQKLVGKKLMKVLVEIVTKNIHAFMSATPLDESDVKDLYKPVKKTVSYDV